MNYFDEDESTHSVSLTRALLLTVAVGAAVGATTWVVFGRTMVEKLATGLVMPVGLIWMLLTVTVGVCWVGRQRAAGFFATVAWFVLTALGNSYVANELISALENEYTSRPAVAPGDVDTVVVLGGGTTTNLRGHSQLSTSGDRIAAAARYFVASKSAGFDVTIICTGTQKYRSHESDLDPRLEAKNSLIALGIPPEKIQLLEGANTSEEMQNLKKRMDSQSVTGNPSTRLGILTSTWHLSRAMRLAEANGIEATPMTSDSRAQYPAPNAGMIVPTSANLNISAIAIKESLAKAVNR